MKSVSGQITPLQAAACGAVAGLASTMVLTVLMRTMPGMKDKPEKKINQVGGLPEDPFSEAAVREWQDHSRSPAAFSPAIRGRGVAALEKQEAHAAIVTPAGALAEAQGPGPEGAAEGFALKLASGLFDADISKHGKMAGEIVHYSYGTFWGAVYGLLHASFRRPPRWLGPLFGAGLWAFGPGFMVPRMKLMRGLKQESPFRTAQLIAGHLLYGATLAGVCRLQTKRR